ncbi:hypothetical protein [Catenulispora sp. EB89]|uniref:hypothetical protein n=1 Tax=Catenulispora sp. EB89 TaxID=3156257 RepID=UPI003516874D
MKNGIRDQGGGMSWKHVQSWADKHPVPSMVLGGVAAALVLGLVGLLVWKLHGKDRSVKVRGLVALGTLMATMVQASGMWHFFGDVMHMSLAYKIVMFPFLEILILAFGLKALEKAEEAGNWLIYAVMLWILAISSGGMSASDSSGFREGLFRLLVAAVIAVLWTLDLLDLWLKARKRKAEEEGRPLEKVRWRFTPRELGIRLGLASADGSTLSDLDANRHFERYLRVSDKLRILKEHNARDGAIQRIAAREAKAKAKLQRHARLHADPSALMSALGAQAVADAQARLGIDEAQTELRQAQDQADEHAAEVGRLAELLDREREASKAAAEEAAAKFEELSRTLKADQAAATSAAEKERADLTKQVTKLRDELETVRARTVETDIELEKSERSRRELAADMEIERRERTSAEQLWNNEKIVAKRRIADLERDLNELRSRTAAAIPAQRPAPVAVVTQELPVPVEPVVMPVQVEPVVSAVPVEQAESDELAERVEPSAPSAPPISTANGAARTSAKQAFYDAADHLTDQGANHDHPLLSEHGPTRNHAVRALADSLGVKELTIRKYAKSYRDERISARARR